MARVRRLPLLAWRLLLAATAALPPTMTATAVVAADLPSAASLCADVYVSQAGSDANSGGSAATAVLTLERAQEIARQQLARGRGALERALPARGTIAASGVTVHLTGTFARTQSLHFTRADSGSSWQGHNSGGSQPAIITGAVHLPAADWTPVTDKEVLAKVLDKSAAMRLLQLDVAHGPVILTAAELGSLSRHGFSLGASSKQLRKPGRYLSCEHVCALCFHC